MQRECVNSHFAIFLFALGALFRTIRSVRSRHLLIAHVYRFSCLFFFMYVAVFAAVKCTRDTKKKLPGLANDGDVNRRQRNRRVANLRRNKKNLIESYEKCPF